MPRPRSARVQEVKAALAARLRGPFAAPGRRFLSGRAVARRFAVSYQTAHRLLGELAAEGLLRRAPASGSYLPGARVALRGVQLVFHARARRPGSFGDHLRTRLETELRARGISVVRSWPAGDAVPRLRPDRFPVIWECRAALDAAATGARFALCLHDRPPPGLAAGRIDALLTDDCSGGACAADLLRQRTGRAGPFAVLAGPRDDPRCLQRVAGFLARAPGSAVLHADSWYLEAGLAVAPALLDLAPAGIFACNDRLAEALLLTARRHARPLPALAGFDNAPIAERLRLTTVGVPWSELVRHAADLVAARLRGDASPARVTILHHEPVHRLTC